MFSTSAAAFPFGFCVFRDKVVSMISLIRAAIHSCALHCAEYSIYSFHRILTLCYYYYYFIHEELRYRSLIMSFKNMQFVIGWARTTTHAFWMPCSVLWPSYLHLNFKKARAFLYFYINFYTSGHSLYPPHPLSILGYPWPRKSQNVNQQQVSISL